jgi:hypothetical protein
LRQLGNPNVALLIRAKLSEPCLTGADCAARSRRAV